VTRSVAPIAAETRGLSFPLYPNNRLLIGPSRLRPQFRVFQHDRSRQTFGRRLDYVCFTPRNGHRRCDVFARNVALAIRARITAEAGLNSSVGISHNKFLAKLAALIAHGTFLVSAGSQGDLARDSAIASPAGWTLTKSPSEEPA
jgi:hypothetical protein